MNAITQPEKAQLIPLKGNEPEMARALTVHFNPASLKVSLANTLKAPKKAGAPAQYVDKSTSKLAFELIYDTTLDGGDVRIHTGKVAELFMKPGESTDAKKVPVPNRCRFAWGSFIFDGLMDSFNETLEFFAPEGVPLRAVLSLSLSEDEFQFLRKEGVTTAARTPPEFKQAAVDEPFHKEDSDKARDIDMANGNGNLRGAESGGLMSGGDGFAADLSERLGTTIPGAFDGPGVGGTSALGLGEVSTGISVGVGAGSNTGAEVGSAVQRRSPTWP